MNKAVVGTVLALIVIATIQLVGMPRERVVVTSPATSSPPSLSAQRALPAEAPMVADSPSKPSTALGTAPEVAKRFRAATDYRRFFDEAVAAGGGANIHFAEIALSTCLGIVQKGVVADEQNFLRELSIEDPHYGKRLKAYQDSVAPCKGFEGFPADESPFRRLYRQKTLADDSLSRAAKLVRGTARVVPPGANEARARAATGMLDLGDPYVLMELRPIGRRTADSLKDFPEEAAWRMAAADLGVVSFDPRLGALGLCAWQGDCDIPPEEVIGRQWYVQPKDWPKLLARREAILDAYRRKDWAALGF